MACLRKEEVQGGGWVLGWRWTEWAGARARAAGGGHLKCRECPEGGEAGGMPCVCVHVHTCMCMCEGAGGGQQSRPPARIHAHRCPAGIPTDTDIPALGCPSPPGPEQLLLNQGPRQPRGGAGLVALPSGLPWGLGPGLEGGLSVKDSGPEGVGLVWRSLFWKLE